MTLHTIMLTKLSGNKGWVYGDPSKEIQFKKFTDGDFCDRIVDRCYLDNSIRGHVFTMEFSTQSEQLNYVIYNSLDLICQSEIGLVYQEGGRAYCLDIGNYFDDPPKAIYYRVHEESAVLRVDSVLANSGHSLVYCEDYDLVDKAVKAFWDKDIDHICKEYPTVDWINLHIVDR